MYTEPKTVYEYVNETRSLTQLNKGDQLSNGARIGEVVIGHKYVTVKAENGQQLWRELIEAARDMEIEVSVRRETKDSRDAAQRYDANKAILRELERYESNFKQSVAYFKERWEAWGDLHYDFLGGMLEAEAEHKLWARFAANVDRHVEEGSTHQEAMALYVDDLKELLINSSTHRGLSRSTNQLSNLMDSVANEQVAKFVHAARWFGIR